MIEVALLDIEGTVSPTAAVKTTLFNYAHDRIDEWMRRPQIRRAVGPVDPRTLKEWSLSDAKKPELKVLQGLIWKHGFDSGELSSSVYNDVPAALQRLANLGTRLCVYSSGSVLAQQLWFRHTPYGDLSHLIEAWFDLSAGSKRDPMSYRGIASTLQVTPGQIWFCSDTAAELDAASAAGTVTMGISRAEEQYPDVGSHSRLESMDQVALAAIKDAEDNEKPEQR